MDKFLVMGVLVAWVYSFRYLYSFRWVCSWRWVTTALAPVCVLVLLIREYIAYFGHARDVPLPYWPMRTAGVITFREQFERRVNCANELRFRLR